MKVDKSIYYNLTKIKTYNRLYSIIVGMRGVGKTYALTTECIKIGLKFKCCSFVWLRRQIKNIDMIRKSWWEDVEKDFPQYQFYNIGDNIYAKDIETEESFIIGCYGAISDAVNFKSTPRPHVKIIVFDEFMAEDCGSSYLNDELNIFLNMIDSIVRLRDVKIYLSGNAVSVLNPYFEWLGITEKDLANNFTKGDTWVLENADYEEFRKVRCASSFGKSIQGTKYGEYSINNKFLLDDTLDVMECPKGNKEMMYNLRLHDKLIAVYRINGMLYFDEGRDECFRTYSCYPQDAKTYVCMYIDKYHPTMRFITKLFLQNVCMYKNLKIKNEIQKLVMIVYRNYMPN